MPAYDLTALRLEAARNLGYTAGFLVATGRDFTGNLSDYQALSPEQQVALSGEMYAIIRRDPNRFPLAQQKVAQGPAFAEFKNVPAPLNPGQAALVGAGEGLTALPENVGKAGAALVHSAGQITKAAAEELGSTAKTLGQGTGGLLEGVLGIKPSTLVLIVGAGVFLYFFLQTPAAARGAAYTVERLSAKRNPHRRRRLRRVN